MYPVWMLDRKGLAGFLAISFGIAWLLAVPLWLDHARAAPKLLPLEQWRALLLSGAIWGAWHAPVVALGYNYPQHHALGPLLMIVFCVIFGILLGWSGWLLPLAFIAWLATTRRLPVATA
jgi:hypothetical protein